MNYRHSYHAGNFADVFKHIILISLLQSLLRKETPLCYLETHAGIGLYDLFSDETQRSKEYEEGIKKLLNTKPQTPQLITDYLNCVKKFNSDDTFRYYPGSPIIANELLRPIDRLVLCELNSNELIKLKNCFDKKSNIAIHLQNGYEGLKAHLPPKERRGLILIDPAYEKNDELSLLPHVLENSIKRFETGIYAVWYPIKIKQQHILFQKALKETIKRPYLTAEMCIYPLDIPIELNGCGMIIVNPPWQLEVHLNEVIPWLWKALSVNQKGYVLVK